MSDPVWPEGDVCARCVLGDVPGIGHSASCERAGAMPERMYRDGRGDYCCKVCRQPIMWRKETEDETGRWSKTGICACAK